MSAINGDEQFYHCVGSALVLVDLLIDTRIEKSSSGISIPKLVSVLRTLFLTAILLLYLAVKRYGADLELLSLVFFKRNSIAT